MHINEADGKKILVFGTVQLPVLDGLLAQMAGVKELTTDEQQAIVLDAAIENLPDIKTIDPAAVLKVAQSFVQNGWYVATKGEVPKGVMDGHTARLEKFLKDTPTVKTKPVKVPKAPKEPKAPKAPREPRAPKTTVNTTGRSPIHSTADRRYGLTPDATDPQLKFTQENKFRKLVYEVVVDAGIEAHLTEEEVRVAFLTRAGAELRAADGGKNQTRYRLKELVVAGIVTMYTTAGTPVPVETPTAAVEPVAEPAAAE